MTRGAPPDSTSSCVAASKSSQSLLPAARTRTVYFVAACTAASALVGIRHLLPPQRKAAEQAEVALLAWPPLNLRLLALALALEHEGLEASAAQGGFTSESEAPTAVKLCKLRCVPNS